MHRLPAIAVTAAVAVVVASVAKSVRDEKRQQEQIRAELRENMNSEIEAIRRAAIIVQNRINNGHRYDGIEALMDDLRFNRIVAREY